MNADVTSNPRIEGTSCATLAVTRDLRAHTTMAPQFDLLQIIFVIELEFDE